MLLTESAIDQRLLAARKKNPGKAFKAKKGGFMTDFGEKTQNFKGHYHFFLVIRDLCLIETAIGPLNTQKGDFGALWGGLNPQNQRKSQKHAHVRGHYSATCSHLSLYPNNK